MKTIIIDIPSGLASPSNILSALKVYAHKNKFFSLLACGSPNDMSVLEDYDGIKVDYSEGEKTSTEVALSHLKDPEIAGILTFNDRKVFLDTANRLIEKKVDPVYGLYFPTREEGKDTLLIDAAGFSEENEEALSAYLAYAKDYLMNILKKVDPKISFLALEDALDEKDILWDNYLKKNERFYSGIVGPEELASGKTDIILALGKTGAITLRAAKGARNVAAELEKIRSSKSWAIRFSDVFGKQNTPEKRYDPRLDCKGYLLFGFGYHIVAMNKNSGYGDVIDAFDTLERFDRNQPFANRR